MSAEQKPTIDKSNKLRRKDNPVTPKESSDVSKKNPQPEDVRKAEKKIFKAAVVETTRLVEAQARDIGDHKMTESKEDREKGWFKKTLTRIWKHNLFQEYYRQKEIAQAKKDILSSGNLYTGEEGAGLEQHKQAMNAIVDRFTSEYEAETLRKEEKASKKEADGALNAEMKALIKEYAGDLKMDQDVFEERKKRILKSHDSNYGADNRMHADNLFDIAKEVRDSVTHGQKLSEMDFDVKVVVGEARESLQTEKEKHTFDKILNVMGKTAVGQALVNAGAVGIVAGAYSVTKTISLGAGKKAAKWFGFGAGALAAGGIEAVKESARIKRDRAQHIRERAKGMEFTEPDMERRQEMEKNLYEMRSARDASNEMEAAIARIQNGEIKSSDVNGIIGNLADIEARLKLADTRKIDLVSFSSFSTIERERTDLDLARARLKVALRKGIESKTIAFTQSAGFDEYLKAAITVSEDQLVGNETNGIDRKDAIFQSLKRKSVAKAFVKGTIMSATIGAAIGTLSTTIGQEFFHGGETDGIVAGMSHDNASELHQHATPIEALRRWISHDYPRVPFGKGHEMLLGGTHVQLPDGVNATPNSDGSYNILRGGELVGNHVRLDIDPTTGDLTQVSKDMLAQTDIHANFATTGGKTTETVTQHAKDWVEKNLKGLHHISRAWMGNDTPMYPDPDHPGHLLGADLNELRTHWAGLHGTGISADGHYQLNVQHMTNDGSFQDGVSVAAAAERAGGNLKALLSVTKDSQHFVIEVPIDKNGLIDIDPNTDAGKMLFENVNGHAVYTGAFLEIAKPNGVTPDGREIMQVLGTHIGTDHAHDVTTTVVKDTIVHNVKLDVPAPSDYDVYPIPVPMAPRRPLERGTAGKPLPGPKIPGKPEPVNMMHSVSYGTSGFEGNQNRKAMYEQQLSKALKDNPDANLNQYKEIASYLSKFDKKYMKEIEDVAREMGPLDPDCRLSICVPVAGHQESGSIYKTLENYTNQTADAKTFELSLLVNRPDRDSAGNPVNSDGTLDEIKRFQKDYPNVKVRVTEKIIPLEKVKMGYIRKILSDATLLRSQNRGADARELILVSNDADNKGLAPEYVDNFIKKFDEQPKVDSMLGQLDWDPGSYVRNPLIHVGTRLFQYIGIQTRNKGWHIESSGANFAYRSSIYAAIGGYSEDMGAGEDSELGVKIKAARKGAVEHEPITFAGARTSRLYTSSRRAEKVLKYGLAPIEQWDQGFGAFDDEVRKVKWEEQGEKVDFDNPEKVKKLVVELENVINRTLEKNKIYGAKVTDPIMLRGLNWLGIKYEITGQNSIHITNADKLIQDLKQYQIDGLEILKHKTTIQPKKVASSVTPPVPATSTPEVVPIKPKSSKKSKPAELLAEAVSVAKENSTTSVETKSSEKPFKSLTREDLEAEVKKNISTMLEKIKDKEPEIKSFAIVPAGDGFKIETVVKLNKTGNAFVRTATIDLGINLENKDNQLTLGAYTIEAGIATSKVKEQLEPLLPQLIPTVKEYLEKEYGTKIDSMKIEDGKLNLFDKSSEKVEATPATPEAKENSEQLKPETDYILGMMPESVSGLEADIESMTKREFEAGVFEHPSILIMESDPNKRDAMVAKIEELKTKFPYAQIQYVKLPREVSGLKDMKQQDYISQVIELKRNQAGVSSKMPRLWKFDKSPLFNQETTA